MKQFLRCKTSVGEGSCRSNDRITLTGDAATLYNTVKRGDDKAKRRQTGLLQ